MATKKQAKKSPTTWLPNEDDEKIIGKLKAKLGVTTVAELIRMGLRKLAQAEGIQ
jgi:hypothetical protein